ncbi:MAG: M1 family aminopeptidase [Phycisphaerales bacterium]
MTLRSAKLIARLSLSCGLAWPLAFASAQAHDPNDHAPAVRTDDDDCLAPLVDGCGKAQMLRRRFAAGLGPVDLADPNTNPFSDREAFSDTDVLNNSLDIAVDPTAQTIAGSNTITVKSLVPNLTQFTFALRSNFTVSAIEINGASSALPTTPVGSSYLRTITLNRPYLLNEVFTIKITYNGVPVSAGFGSIEFTTQAGIPVVSSLSEPYYAGTWWPAKDGDFALPGDNSDKATWNLALTTPSSLTGVSNGTLVGTDTLTDGRKRWRWQSNYQTSTYLACFSMTNYSAHSLSYTYNPPGGGPSVTFPFRYYLYPQSDTAANRAAWEKVPSMMDALQPFYGVYPFANEGYGMYEFPFGGGMEHQTMTGQEGYGESLTVHEMGHQWFGDNVTCRTWSDIWFNEGLADYTECVWAEKKIGSTGQTALISALNARKPSSSAVAGTVYVYNTTNDNNIFSTSLVYYKAGWVWHMLRGAMGDTTFWNFLGQIRAQYTGSAVTTEDIRAVADAVTGRDYAPFFNQWVYLGGAPTYVKGYAPLTVNGKTYAKFHIRQSQSATYPIFTTPIDSQFTTGSGSVTYKVSPIARTSWFMRKTPSIPTAFTLDPNTWVLNYGKTTENYVTTGAPPVLLDATPLPGATPEFRTSPTRVQLTFSENMSLSAANFQVLRTGGGSPVPFTYSWNLATLTATLTFESRLSPATYSVQVVGNPTSVATSVALDGDIADVNLASSLPSGNGAPGGSASYNINVVAGPCPADLNNDGVVDDSDFVLFASAYDELDTMAGDISGDAQTDDADFVLFAVAYDAYSCPS